MHGWNSVEQTAHGWVGPGGYRSLALDTSGSYTHVYAALNMWRSVESDYEFHFRIFRWDGAATTLATENDRNASSSYAPSGNGNWTLDAMTVNQNEATLLYKMTPKDRAEINRWDSGTASKANLFHLLSRLEISADLMSETCESCLNFNDVDSLLLRSAPTTTPLFSLGLRVKVKKERVHVFSVDFQVGCHGAVSAVLGNILQRRQQQ